MFLCISLYFKSVFPPSFLYFLLPLLHVSMWCIHSKANKKNIKIEEAKCKAFNILIGYWFHCVASLFGHKCKHSQWLICVKGAYAYLAAPGHSSASKHKLTSFTYTLHTLKSTIHNPHLSRERQRAQRTFNTKHSVPAQMHFTFQQASELLIQSVSMTLYLCLSCSLSRP